MTCNNQLFLRFQIKTFSVVLKFVVKMPLINQEINIIGKIKRIQLSKENTAEKNTRYLQDGFAVSPIDQQYGPHQYITLSCLSQLLKINNTHTLQKNINVIGTQVQNIFVIRQTREILTKRIHILVWVIYNHIPDSRYC